MTKESKRIYVCKKDEFDYKSKSLLNEINSSLNLDLDYFKAYRRYDIEIGEDTLENILYTVLSEPPVDELYYEDADKLEKSFENPIAIQYQAGQFDNREAALVQTIALFTNEEVKAKVTDVYDIKGVGEEDLERIKEFLINPVDSVEVDPYASQSMRADLGINTENIVFDGFIDMGEEELADFLEEKSLAMSLEDLKIFQDYFKKENRDPNETELAIIDTYWSDHCRHTTFNTGLDIDFDVVTDLDKKIKVAFDDYLAMRDDLAREKEISLMDFSTILAKYLKKEGKLDDLEVSSEINACSVKVKVRVQVDGKEELRDYLLMFKNETHNHPTEIEPVGGASTCLGGAIRDPLSGRSYVYQAMRVTGAGDPFTPLEDTLEGKLPQMKITNQAAKGYSSYGNQIGLATGLVDEIYHPGYVAKRMETGAVVAAAPSENVKRLEPKKGDLVLLVGGKTGRDGIGGATGSSKSHNVESIQTESAQVQKGNAPEERKIQRLFRMPEVAQAIKKSNDFGAGGVSVAIGELTDSIEINLDKVPLKYDGMKAKEIAISESQERMAIVVAAEDAERIIDLAAKENLDATEVAHVTDDKRMKMYYKGKLVVDMGYDFINSTGAVRRQDVKVVSEKPADFLKDESKDPKKLKDKLADLNITSKKNLIELFDGTVGRATVLHPLGGASQLTPIQAMSALIPSLEGKVKTASLMSYGFNPYLSSQSQFLGGYYAVIESIAKLVAQGASLDRIRLSFQEFYEKLSSEEAWSKPLKSLLGAFVASKAFDAPPIGGKDSMSGSFEDIHVPPTLISFAVTTADVENIISPDFKGKGKIGLIKLDRDENGMLDLDEAKDKFNKLSQDIRDKNVLSAAAIGHKGSLVHIFEMALGSTGFDVELDDLYSPLYGSFIVEYLEDRDFIEPLGSFLDQGEMIVNGQSLDVEELKKAYLHTLDPIFKPSDSKKLEEFDQAKAPLRRLKSDKPVDEVKVVIPAFPGTNSEWDTAKAFERAGAKAEILVFRNRNNQDIDQSIENLAQAISSSQILCIPGGFSLADEPDGSGKFIANVLRSAKIKDAIDKLLNENDGLILGICNGFQALLKSGLLPYGELKILEEDDPTLSFNKCYRHVAKFVDTKLMTTNSPWLQGLEEGKSYRLPISHGEGRFVADEDQIKKLKENEQIALVYEDCPNGSTLNIESIISEDGKIMGKMGHSERVAEDLYKNIPGIEVQEIFKAGVDYFKKDK